ncbi:MAG: TatD family hydrolase [Bacteroidia bacterium]|nr:TatD family hydrolase [Bacteroidia bacterium]
MIIDAHTHKYREYPDNSEVLQVVNIQSRAEFESLKNKHNVILSYGLHPWLIDDHNIDWSLLHDVSIVGEIGIDKAINTPIDKQIAIFEEQLQYAKESNKDVIVHCVRAYNEVQQSLKKINFPNRVLFHAYRSTLEMAQQLMRCCDAYFSFGSRELSFPKCQYVKENLPQERVFWETDNE